MIGTTEAPSNRAASGEFRVEGAGAKRGVLAVNPEMRTQSFLTNWRTARRGNGLANLRKRAAALGAGLDVRSEPGRGARVVLSVPLRPPA